MKTKKQLTNRILSLVLTFVMVLGMLPMSSFTAFAAERGAATTVDLSTLTGTYVISDSGEYTFTGSGSYGIKVESGNPTIVLNNASITVDEGSAIDIASGSNATIFVLGDNTIGTTKTEYSDVPCGGIFVAEGGTVNITSNGTDNILRAHGTLAAAIGGKYVYNGESYNAGSISISNVTVYAYTNNYYAAAIGAAGNGTCGTINITNAVVYAYGAGDNWTSAPGIGSACDLVGWPETIPVVIISDSEIHTFRYNPYSDYIGYLGDELGEEGGFHATGSINCGEGGSVKSSTIYCYTGLDATTTDKVVKYGALGGLLKEDGTCEGEHTGIICDNCGYCSCTHESGELTYALTEDGTQHTATWSCCGTKVTEDHSTTTEGDRLVATCQEKAYCSVCKSEYGVVNPDNHESENYTYTDNGDGTHTKTHECGVTVGEPENHTIENHVCTACGAMEIVVSFNAGDFEWKTGDKLYFCRVSGDNEWEEYAFTATVAGDGTVTWTPDRTLYWDGTGEHKLVVIYPDTGYVWDTWYIDEDQSTLENLRKNDHLNSIWSGNPTTDTITFNLKHRMAKVTVNYEAAEGVTVSKAEVYTLTQYVFFDVDTLERRNIAWEEGDDLWIHSYLNDGQFTAFVSPDAYAADGNFIKIALSDGSVREVKMNKAVTFEEGAEYTYKVVITADGAYLTCADECSFEYTANEDGLTHSKVCTECGYVENASEAHTPNASGCTNNGGDTHSYTCACGISGTEAHTLTYSANGTTITESCSANCGHTATAAIRAEGKTYDGTAVTASVAYSDNWLGGNLTIAYAVKDGDALNEAPKNAGAYTASITIGGATVSVDFTIAKAVPTYTVPLGLTATYGQTLGEVTLTTPSGGTPGSWTWNDESTTSVGNAGSNTFKATFTPDDKNYKTVEADITIVVAKATPIVSAPTAVSGLVYTGEALALVGAGSTTGGTLQYSLDNAAWSTEIPTATNAGDYTVYYKVVGGENYEDVAAQSINVTITDKTAPAGTILIKENGWNKFWNTITFGIFCKDYVDVTITADGTGSGVAKVEYLLSETAIDENNIPDDGWTTLTKDGDAYKFQIQPQNKVAVYVRITDEGGNVTVINSDGIVAYEDSEAITTDVFYTYEENSDKDITVALNGNTVKSVACEGEKLTVNTDYTVDGSVITLKAEYLDRFAVGTYTFTVSYNPMGVKDSGVTDLTTTFTVKVEPTSIAGATVNVNGTFTYDGNAKTPEPVVMLNGETLVKDQDYTVSYNNNTNATNDGQATVIVTGKGNYTGSVNGSFEIERAKLTDVSVQQNGKLTYDGGKALTPAVTANATALNGARVYFIYSTDGRSYSGMPSFTDAGTYTVYYCAYTTDNNFIDQYDTFTVTIDKAIVTEPTIASKPYNNSAQTADISDTDLYTVVKNEGGTEKGSYDVVLKLKDSANYKWSTTDNAEVTLQFVISAAQNSWETKPAISGWTYGETAKAPTYKAKFGTVKVVYSGKANDGTDYNSETAPTKAGSYTATFTVEGTEDYSGLSQQVNFTIAKKAVTVTANDASKTYGDSDPTFTYTHTDLVGSDALVITVARASGENANTYTITASQAEGANPNYEITFKNGTFTIGKAALTVTAEDKTAIYGDVVPNYTVKYDGFKNGDDKDDLGGALAFACDYAQFSDKGEYTIKASGYTSGNYTINYVDGKLNVSAKPITITIQNATSIYGEALAELKATDNGIVNNDKDVYSLATVATSTSNVAKYAITGTALDSNYAITFVNGEYEITKREITITVEAKNTIVNTALPTYTYKVEGLVGEDKLETEPTLTSDADITVIGEYDITATGADAGGNYSIKYVPAKLTVLTDNAVDAAADYNEELKDYDPATVTSEDKTELDEILNEINTILDDENITDNGKKALEEVKEQVEKLIKEITDAADATDTENVGKVENVTPENVTPENKTDLEGAKADLEKALEDNGGNYTDDEKKAIEDEIKRIDEALEVIGNVEAVEEVVSKLPAVDTVKPDDEEAIKVITDAQTAYNALSDYEKSLVDKDTKAALDKLVAALVAYDIVEGDGSSWTEDSDHNITFVVNGLFGKFVGIKVNGKDVDKANYEVKAGSTIITLKASYLDTLAVGEHTITVVYTDGSTDGTFNVHAKANSPATGDDFNIALYGSLMVVSVTALVVLLLASKKKKYAK